MLWKWAVVMEPVLRTCGNHVSNGRIICAVCFDSIAAKRKRKSNFHEVKNNEEFLKTAKSWTEYEHDFASVLDKHDPASTKTLYYHHKCQQFFDERHRQRQTKKTLSGDADSEMEVEAGIETEHLSTTSRIIDASHSILGYIIRDDKRRYSLHHM